MLFQFCSHIFYRTEVRAVWWPRQYLDFVVLKPFLPQLWKYAWGHCSFGRPICNQALTSWLMSWDVASIYPHLLVMPSILWSAPVPPASKHPHNMMLPPPCFTVGMVFCRLQASPVFLQTYRWSLWPNSSIFVSSDQRTIFQKVRSLSPCAVANRSLAF